MSLYRLEHDGKIVEVEVDWDGETYVASMEGQQWEVRSIQGEGAEQLTDSESAAVGTGDVGQPPKKKPVSVAGAIHAPIAGSISKLLVDQGQSVTPGQAVLKLEAMKMETEITAGRAGVVTELFVQSGDRVEEGEALLVIEPSTEEGESN